MNNNRGTQPTRPPANGQRRPAPRPAERRSAPTPNVNRPAPRQSGYRRAPEGQPPHKAQSRPPVRPNPHGGYGRYQRGRGNEDFLMLCVIILAVLLVALIITFIILKAADSEPEGNSPAESTPAPSESVGADAPDESGEPFSPDQTWRFTPDDPKAFKPITDSTTVTLPSSKIYSKNIIMMDVSSGISVCEFGADTRIYPASMTKLMTAIVACDLIDNMNDTFALTNEILYPLNQAGASMAYFLVDNEIPMIDLIYGTLLPSGADATAGLAIALAGTEEKFVELMNRKAIEMGCYGTHFTNASGLHNENHYSTVRDMAAIMAYAVENPFLKAVISSKSYKTVAPVDRTDGTVYCTWSAPLSSYSSNVATMFGAKTGYTPEAGNCLASISRTSDGKEYIIVSAGAFFNDQMTGKNQPFADVKYLCDNYIK